MRRFGVVVLCLGLALSACGESSDGDDAAAVDTTAPAAGGGPTVAVGDTSLGKVLVDGKGMTLYLFTKDSGGTSACEGGCAELWPPLMGTATAGSGADGSKLGTITRPDGATQATYAGHPLYYYAQDAKPGDVNGQNVGNVWFALTPDGTQAGSAPAGSAPAGGYGY